MAPKLRSSDVGNSDRSKRSHQVHPLSKKVKVLREMKKSCAEDSEIYSNELSIHEIVKKEKNFMLVLLSHLKLQKLGPQRISA